VITNNVTRMLQSRKIDFSVHELPAEKLGAIEAAQILGVPPEQVFKTIVITRPGKGKPILAVVPGSSEVDLKRVAQATGEKKVHLPTEKEAEQLTGLQAGGISPLALIQRGFQVLIDKTALSYEKIFISGGQRGLNIELPARDLIKLTNARPADIRTNLSAENQIIP
jgi:Cys-tRNA(Pro)/Cys-tRNA(Cys) deacylase